MRSEWLVHRGVLRQRDKQACTLTSVLHTHSPIPPHISKREPAVLDYKTGNIVTDSVRISTGNHIRIRAANQKCCCIYAHKHTTTLLHATVDLCDSHKETTLFCVFMWACACLFTHKLMWTFTTAGLTWSARLSSHWLVFRRVNTLRHAAGLSLAVPIQPG